MARTNRNNREILATTNIEETTYKTAVYVRLSVEDNGIGGDSIDNQIYMIKKYIKGIPSLSLVSTHVDNGMTGTNFERPGFIAMLEEVKKGKINCIIVKDLSRFGRNYMETGNYLENIFPYLGVRFISINDNYDSIDTSANEALGLSLKNVYHHIYAKDISRKICTSFDVKKKNGLFLAKYAPYGYKKSKKNHYKLEIDEETAPIVRKIFKFRMDGLGVVAIARKLNESGVLSQYRRLYETGHIKGTNSEATALWSGSSVLGILENPNYYGCIVERKSDAAYYKGGKKKILPKDEWNYIENTHEPLVDKATFEAVQNIIAESKQTVSKERQHHSNRKRTENIFRGLVVCGSCKWRMTRDGGYYDTDGNLIRHRYGCKRKYINSGSCTTASVIESDLMDSVFEMIKVQISLLADTKELLNDYLMSSDYEIQKNGFINEITATTAELSQIKIKILALYKDYKQGLLSESGYVFAQKKYETKQIQYEEQLCELERKQSNIQKRIEPDTGWIREVLTFRDESCLTREMCVKLIEYIEVFNTHITVKYTFRSEYESLLAFISKNFKAGEEK